MTPEQFCYWLQGRAELDPTPPTLGQWQSICEHLDLVFDKVTPPVVLEPAKEALIDVVTAMERRRRIRRATCGSDSLRLC